MMVDLTFAVSPATWRRISIIRHVATLGQRFNCFLLLNNLRWQIRTHIPSTSLVNGLLIAAWMRNCPSLLMKNARWPVLIRRRQTRLSHGLLS